jgi:ribosomal protein S18 acetylase RimI-like enzyme
MELHIKKLDSLEEFYKTYPLVTILNPELQEARFRTLQEEAVKEGYRCIVAFQNPQEMLGMCGYWIRHRFYCGRGLHIDNIATAPHMQGRGVGSVMMQWIKKEAVKQKCDHLVLDTYLENKDAHGFYLKHQLRVSGLHFMQKL